MERVRVRDDRGEANFPPSTFCNAAIEDVHTEKILIVWEPSIKTVLMTVIAGMEEFRNRFLRIR